MTNIYNLCGLKSCAGCLDAIADLLSKYSNAITGNSLLGTISVFNLSLLAEKVYRILDSVPLRSVFNSDLFDKTATLLSDVAIYGTASTLQQCFTWNALRLSGMFSEIELRTLMKHGFIHPDGYIDIDFVLLRIQSRVCVIFLSLMVISVLVVYLPSDLVAAIFSGNMNLQITLFAIFVLVVSLSVASLCALLAMYKIFLEGILPLVVANRLFYKRGLIEELGPRCMFVGDNCNN